MSEERAVAAMDASGIAYRLVRYGRVGSLAEAAAARGVEPADVVKSLVIRRADDDYLFILVPGARSISWPKLRALLGVARLSMPDAATALADRILANAPHAVRASRRVALACLEAGDEDAWSLTHAAMASVVSTEDFAEGPRAFIEKRPPVWKGR